MSDNVQIELVVNKQKLSHLRSALSILLSESICKVLFEKIDGSERVMKCTLRPELLPPPKGEKSDKKPNLDALPVYEIAGDKSGWRSFRLDSLKSIEVVYE